MENRIHIKADSSASSNVDAYYEYRMIVGDDDKGKMFSPHEYESYKKKMSLLRSKNRIYVSWSNSNGMDCKLIGPESLCFCQHRYKQHKTDFEVFPTDNSEIKCEVTSCKCSGFFFIPKNGNQTLRCHCKHYVTDHSEKFPFKCRLSCKCNKFQTSYRCGCGELAKDHQTLIESREMRMKRGHPVSRVEPPYKAMGGITGLSSMMDGYLRLDESGIGSPSNDWFANNSSTSLQPSQNPPIKLTVGVRRKILHKNR